MQILCHTCDWTRSQQKFGEGKSSEKRLDECPSLLWSSWEAGRQGGREGWHFVGHLRMLKMQFKMIYVFIVWTTECWGHRKCYELLPVNYNWLPSPHTPPSLWVLSLSLPLSLSNRELIKWRQWEIYDSFDGWKGRERETVRVRGRFDKVFVCANSLYSIVRQAQQWKLPLELSAGEEGFKAIYTKNKKNGKAMHSSAAREADPNGTSTVVAPLLLAGDSFTIALPYRRLSSVCPGYPALPLAI